MSRAGIALGPFNDRAMTINEVAAALGEKPGTISAIEQRALRKLRTRMSGMRMSDLTALEFATDNDQLVHFNILLTPEVL